MKKKRTPTRAVQRGENAFLFNPPPCLIMYLCRVLISYGNYFFYDNCSAISEYCTAKNKPSGFAIDPVRL